jgi:hypothetical protein
MQTYFVRRTCIATGARELDAALTRLRSFEERPSGLAARWLHSYALREADGRFGLACLFEAEAVPALLRHAESIRLPASEVLPVTGTQVVRAFAPTLVFLVRRRNAWRSVADLDRSAAAVRCVDAGGLAGRMNWLRSYTVREDDGTLGSVSLHQSTDAKTLLEHAALVGIPASEITPVIGRIVFRDGLDEQRMPSAAALA